jgi:copper resistance protein D
VISIWVIIRWLHLMSAIAWIGGMLFIGLVLIPVTRAALPSTERTLLFDKVGHRYGMVSTISLVLLLVTGYFNGEHRQVDWAHLMDTPYGQTLALKLALVALVIGITLVHALYVGRRIIRLTEQAHDLGAADAQAAGQRRRLQIISIALSGANLMLNLAIVMLAAALAT